MNNISTIRIILHISFSLLFCCNIYTQAEGTDLENSGGIVVNANGDTRVAQWKDDKIAAFSLNFDDSMPSHVENAIPALKERGLIGTFYVNPGKSRHKINEQFWQNLLNEGQAMAPHTMNHIGASSYDEGVYEIGESAKYVWDVYGVPHYTELHAYASGGGVTWTGFTEEQRREIEDSFLFINRYHYNASEPHWHSDRLPRSKGGNTSASSLIGFFDHSVSEGKWEAILFHGVGGGWISIDLDEFITFVDYLETKKDTVWIGPWIDVYKYDMERFSVQVQVLQNTDDIIELRLSSDISASGYITNDVNLYNEPLTLITQVPWSSVTVTQGSSSKTYAANNGEVMYEALPNVGTTNRGDIILEQSDGLPVELTFFSASVKNSSVILSWETATEVNNYGFEIFRSVYPVESGAQDDEWATIGFVEGHGNSNSPKYYYFGDTDIRQSSNYYYRLKQIDNDGTFEYSNVVMVTVGVPVSFTLNQNYPNPFNPSTTISYLIPEIAFISIRIYDVLGNEVMKYSENQEAGYHKFEFDASDLTSGIYLYRLQAGSFIETKKMVLMK